jgi:zinc transport system substrate-binding protein
MNTWKLIRGLLLALTVAVSGASCGGGGTDDRSTADQPIRDAKLSVYVVNYPLAYFAERIGGSLVDVRFLTPGDEDPAFWIPNAEAITEFQQADLILLNGASYAKWVERVTLPASKLVDTSAGFRDQYIIMDNAVVHTHGPEGEHEHGDVAFTTWIDFKLAVRQAEAVLTALQGARPDKAETFQKGFDRLRKDLEGLDQSLSSLAEQLANTSLLGSHPVYQYLARGYGLDLESVHFEPDEAPAASQLTELRQLLEEHPAEWMLWEGAPIENSVSSLRELGISSIVFNPCGNAPRSGDFLSVMQENVENLERVLAKGEQE